MPFPYEHYETLAEPLTVYYPTGQHALARWIAQSIEKAGKLLAQLLDRPVPALEIILVAPTDWSFAPREDPEEPDYALPYWTNANRLDRKSTRLNSSHQIISYAVFCLKKKNNITN